jgi:glucoamylase
MAQHWALAAFQLKTAIEKHLWSKQANHFLRGLNLFVSSSLSDPTNQSLRQVKMNGKTHHVQLQDSVLDISLLGLSVPFGVFSPDDPRMQATADAIARHLTSPIGGIFRYQNDIYRGGNPWILCTLWLAWFDVLAASASPLSHEYHISRARELYTWVLEHRTSLDLLAEQIDCVTGQPCWVVPLAWSHAMFLLVSAALEQSRQ